MKNITGIIATTALATILLTGCSNPDGVNNAIDSMRSTSAEADNPGDSASAPKLNVDRHPEMKKYRVDEVRYGDTVLVKQPNEDENAPGLAVYLLGTDAPATGSNPELPKECGGPASRDALRDLLPVGTEVYLVEDPDTGTAAPHKESAVSAYYVELAQISEPDQNPDVNQQMVADGYARASYDEKATNNHVPARYKDYKNDEAMARDLNSGIWGSCKN